MFSMMLPLDQRVAHIQVVAAERAALYAERCWIENDEAGFTGWRWEKHSVQLKIVCAANRYKDFVVLGARHFCVSMNAGIDLIGLDALHAYANGDEEQGFIDQYGTFHDRKAAALIAISAGQVKATDLRGTYLFSEDLY